MVINEKKYKKQDIKVIKTDAVYKSVGSGLTYLVIVDPNSTSSKAVAARKLGTKLISEEEFLDLVK